MAQHTGGCQCGKVRYRVDVDFGRVLSCNCSRCDRLGLVLAFTPTSKFELLSGEDEVTEYKFNKHVIQHLFCKTCGVQSFARGQMPDGSKIIAINVRCLDDVDRSKLTITPVDGKSR